MQSTFKAIGPAVASVRKVAAEPARMFHPHDHAGWQTWAAEASLAVLMVATAVVGLLVGGRTLTTIASRGAAFVVRQRPACGLVVFAASLAVSAAVARHAGLPRPVVQDEFSYLLAADTFAHGRLTNPTPPGADALQSPHELVRPTYMSKYPPGQGLTLAAGQVATGLPVVGVWVTLALAAAAVYWAAAAFVPLPWAVLAGLMAAVHPQGVDWSHVYWGGGVAALGGALVVGAAGRLRDRREAPDVHPGLQGIVLGVGLAILANSRPYEGLAMALPVLWLVGRPVWLPLAIVLVPTAALMMVDNAAVTGHPLTPPIVAYARQFDVYPKVWFLPNREPPPAYPNDLMAAIHLDFERGEYPQLRTPLGLVRISLDRAWQLAADYAGAWAMLLPLAAATFDRRARWVWATLGTLLLALWAETFFLPHYAAPATAAVLVLVTVGWRRLWRWWPPVGVGIGVAFAAAAAVSTATIGIGPARTGRDDVTASLGPGRQLVFVQYLPGHLPADEWVYNGADPPAERVVWAHCGGRAADDRLSHLYPGRRAWLLTVGATDLRLDPYPLRR